MKKPCDMAECTISSVQMRFKLILKSCVQFAACLKTVKYMKKSGHTEEDDVILATAMYNKHTVSYPMDDVGKHFNFLRWCYLLRDLPKLQEAFSPITNSTSSNPGENNTEGDNENPSCSESRNQILPKKIRPDGRRKSKED